MYTLLVFISTVISILLMIIVLMQASKGEGLSGTFGAAGGSAMGAMFGSRRTADFLSKATWWLAGSLAVLAIVINLFFLPGQSTTNQRESIIQKSGRQEIPQTPSLPQQSTAPVQQNSNPSK